MHTSTDQVRDLTLDAVDGARKRASGVVTHGAERVASAFDDAATTIGDGVERLSERVPSVGVAVDRPGRRHWLRTVLVVSTLLVAALLVARKVLGNGAEETASEPSRPGTDGRSPEEGRDAEADDEEPLEDANVTDG